MKEQLIKQRDRLLEEMGKYRFDPTELVPILDMVLKLNNEIRNIQVVEHIHRDKLDSN